MFSYLIEKLPVRTQARLGLWLTEKFADYQDVAVYDSEVLKLLGELRIECETYAIKPGFDYRDMALELWPIFILVNNNWLPVLLPNPFYEPQAKTITYAEEPITLLLPD